MFCGHKSNNNTQHKKQQMKMVLKIRPYVHNYFHLWE